MAVRHTLKLKNCTTKAEKANEREFMSLLLVLDLTEHTRADVHANPVVTGFCNTFATQSGATTAGKY